MAIRRRHRGTIPVRGGMSVRDVSGTIPLTNVED